MGRIWDEREGRKGRKKERKRERGIFFFFECLDVFMSNRKLMF